MKEFETDPVYMKALEWFVLLQDVFSLDCI